MTAVGACQPVALRSHGWSAQRQPRRSPSAVHAQQPQQEQQDEARPVSLPLPPPPPAVGWLWDKKASADTRRKLQEQKLRPKKSLGQNFMLDDGVLADIVEAAGVGPGDLVLEIGPGTGNLTRHLLAAGALVTAVEKDNALSEQLTQEFAEVPQLRLICGDILRQDVPQLLADMSEHPRQLEQLQGQQGQQGQAHAAEATQPAAEGQQLAGVQQQQGGAQQAQQGAQQIAQQAQRGIKVVANLPYYITKDCLMQMLPLGGQISSVYFMLQDEVGVRLTQVDPGAADWRAMNILTQYYSRPRYLFKIDRRKYLPAPKVHGAVVAFELTPPEQRLEVPGEPEFVKLVKKAFSQRRKVVRNALRPLWEPADVAASLAAVGLSENARAQDLTLQEFGALAWQLQSRGGSQGQAAGAADGDEDGEGEE